MLMEIIGLRVIHRVKKFTVGTGYGFKQVPGIGKVYELVLKSRKTGMDLKDRFTTWKLSLSTISGMCGSGYTTASWAKTSLKEENDSSSSSSSSSPVTHFPISRLFLKLGEDLPKDFECEHEGEKLLSWSRDGGDHYYPSGWVTVNMDLFRPSGRGHTRPVVWVFSGPSNQGKSTIAASASGNLEVHETDSDENLDACVNESEDDDGNPKMLYAQIIVVGNKYHHTLQDVRDVFAKYELDVDIIPVQF